MTKLIDRPQKAGIREDGAHQILQQNLTALYQLHPAINGNRPTLSLKTGVSDGTLGLILRGKGNPTLKSLEAIATFFHLDVWELFLPALDAKAVIGKGVSEKEAKLHKNIEESMRKLGVTEYKLNKDQKNK